MNYQPDLNRLIESLKNDKSVNPKWRNKIVSQLEIAEALLPKLSSHEMSRHERESLEHNAPLQPNRVAETGVQPSSIPGLCHCPLVNRKPYNPNCPIHGV